MVVVLIVASALFFFWFYLLFTAGKEDLLQAAKGKMLENRLKIEDLRKKERDTEEKLSNYHGLARTVMKVFIGEDFDKKVDKIRKQNNDIQRGNFRSVNILILPGIVLLRKFPEILSIQACRKIRSSFYTLYGKKYPDMLTRNLVAKLLSYPLPGLGLSLTLGVIMMYTRDLISGLAVMGIGSALILVLVYAMYDDVADRVNKRKDAIVRQYPNVLSKLALLVTSGMIMNRAWIETADSKEGELYQEMRKTADELNNLVAPDRAYSDFIDRCNTKETTKLASAIMQNMTKGNAEIGQLLQQMAEEAWMERRNMAKRDSENANSKLMIPTMMLFGAILIMLMVPVIMSLG